MHIRRADTLTACMPRRLLTDARLLTDFHFSYGILVVTWVLLDPTAVSMIVQKSMIALEMVRA